MFSVNPMNYVLNFTPNSVMLENIQNTSKEGPTNESN